MSLLNIQHIEAKARFLAQGAAIPDTHLPLFGRGGEAGRPGIEVDGQGYRFSASDRGEIVEDRRTTDTDELMLWIMEWATWRAAGEFELAHRNETQDFRRMFRDKQLELLGLLSQNWQERVRQKWDGILAQYPFDDGSSQRLELYKNLQKNGLNDDEAWRRACERFPLPA